MVSTEEFHYQRLSEAYNRGFDKMAEHGARLLDPEAVDRAMIRVLDGYGTGSGPGG
ncbi:MAG: hypothetical protein HY787_29020 [Deltaproteobacteria bacterium]|nr:hypothetical protein [Deltaproteobacteria bacterium]